MTLVPKPSIFGINLHQWGVKNQGKPELVLQTTSGTPNPLTQPQRPQVICEMTIKVN